MENYIMLDGKKIVLTEEQVAQLRSTDSASHVPSRFNPCDRTKGSYWYCTSDKDSLISAQIRDDHDFFDDAMYNDNANYFNDEGFAMYVALNQLLYRKLLQYAYNNDIIDKHSKDDSYQHYYIVQRIVDGKNVTTVNYTWCDTLPCTVYFETEEGAQKAIDEVVKPLMDKYPAFRVW